MITGIIVILVIVLAIGLKVYLSNHQRHKIIQNWKMAFPSAATYRFVLIRTGMFIQKKYIV
jgi:hypothetical protein